jgi:hypothetical protein
MSSNTWFSPTMPRLAMQQHMKNAEVRFASGWRMQG